MNLIYELQACVKKAQTVLDARLGAKIGAGYRGINFQAGTFKEITQTLDAWGKSDTLRFEKMPCVCLRTPYFEAIPRGGELYQFKGTFFIACATQTNWKRYQREIETFGPILEPIVKEFINQLTLSPAAQVYSALDIGATLLKHDSLSKEKNANIFNEYVDAIEIRDLTFNLTPESVCELI